MGAQPDHLVPIKPFIDKYSQLIANKLLVTPGDYGRMVFLPPFRAEYALSVYGDHNAENDILKPRSFYITLTRATKSIWGSMPENNPEKKQQDFEVERIDVTIDKVFAVAIQRAWAKMLLRTHYPNKAYEGFDGYTVQFSVFVLNEGDIYGEIGTPDHGLPKKLVDLGVALAEFCNLSVDQRRSKEREIEVELTAFVKEIELKDSKTLSVKP